MVMETLDLPENAKARKNSADTKLVSYAQVNVGFDEESPVVKYARRESLISNQSLQLSTGKTSPDGFKVPQRTRRSVVKVRNAMKSYTKNGPLVLNNFGCTIEQGTIYSLLGSSGCGKTTVLTCILGMRNLQSGTISVFGEKPGTPECGVPGNRVGYMPQELALYGDFSIDETLRYYGALFGMSPKEVKAGRDFIMPLLDLPDETRRVGTLSSGQKRRVSLSIAMIHSPELLILDEPTVGVDALLREKIWDFLTTLVAQGQTSIIITTHYIEEARQSNKIGLMRGGRLLEENDPETLMKEHNAVLLEDIVLKLCRNDKFGNGEFYCYSEAYNPANDKEILEERRRSTRSPSIHSWVTSKEVLRPKNEVANCLTRIKALTLKNFFVMMRNFLLVLFMIMVPSMMITLICVGIGNDPRPMWMGVVNAESNFSNCVDHIAAYREAEYYDDEPGCHVSLLSCRYLDKLPKDIIKLIEFATVEEARQSVVDGGSWGYLNFPKNYSDNVFIRSTGGYVIDDDALDGSFITYQLDMTSKQISGPLKRIIYDSYKDFIKEMMVDCGFNEKLGETPVKALDPIYGKDDTDFREFIAPSLLMGLLFFFPLCSSSIQYILDKKLGTLERAQVAGVHTGEIMIAFFITEGLILLIQSALTLAIITLIFGIEIRGSIFLVMILSVAMGIGGVSMGFVVASFCTEEVQAVLLAMASFFPNFLLSGLLWPIEGMPVAMQYMTYLLPCTFSAEAVRSIISRGWGFTHSKVWPGFATIFIWICVYWSITIFIHKIVLARR